MPAVPVPVWGERPPDIPEGTFGDMLLSPVGPPEPDPELTPEQQRLEVFHAEAQPEDNYANESPGAFHRAGRDISEVCILSGWPPRHQQVGQHCPHGLALASDEEEIIDYT